MYCNFHILHLYCYLAELIEFIIKKAIEKSNVNHEG